MVSFLHVLLLDVSSAFEIAEGMSFPSWNDFADYFKRYINYSKSPVFVIGSSKTVQAYNRSVKNPLPLHIGYQSVLFVCVHHGSCKKGSLGLRPLQRSSKISCPVQILVSYSIIDIGFVIRSIKGDHCGHPVDENTFKLYSINRGMRSFDYLIPRVYIDSQSNLKICKGKTEVSRAKSNVDLLIKYNVSVPKVKQYLRTEHGVEISTMGIFNYKQKRNNLASSTVNNLDKFIDSLTKDAQSDKGMILVKIDCWKQ